MEPEAIEAINGNSDSLGWTAGNHSDFWARKMEDGLVYRLGTLEPEKFVSHKLDFSRILYGCLWLWLTQAYHYHFDGCLFFFSLSGVGIGAGHASHQAEIRTAIITRQF